jgi:dipeptidyl aminopeptidase/acylaminoacyl peptidase
VALISIALYGPRSGVVANQAPAPRLPASLFTGAAGNEGDPVFSPDSQWIAYSWDGGEGGRGDIYLKRIADGDPVRLTSGPRNAWGPTWSHDGSTIAFLRQGSGFVEVAAVPASGGKTKVIARLVQGMAELPNRLTWSGTPDEVIVTDDPRGRSDNLSLYRISIRTGERHLLDEAPPDATDIWPQTSPDRQWIAYLRLRGKDAELRVIPAAGGDSRLIIAQSGIRALAWGSDSKHIVCGFGQSSFDQIREIPLAGGSFRQASFSLQDQSSDLAFSPDGRKVSYVQESRDSNVWQISRDGAAPVKVTSSTRADEDAVYSPNGESIAFSSSRSGNYEIWTGASNGSRLRKLTSLDGFSASPSWSPDGKYVAFDCSLLEKQQIRVVAAEGGSTRIIAPEMFGIVPSWSRDGKWIYFSSRTSGANEIWRIPFGGATRNKLRGAADLSPANHPMESISIIRSTWRTGSGGWLCHRLPAAGRNR